LIAARMDSVDGTGAELLDEKPAWPTGRHDDLGWVRLRLAGNWATRCNPFVDDHTPNLIEQIWKYSIKLLAHLTRRTKQIEYDG
jgi:hypothetical protein